MPMRCRCRCRCRVRAVTQPHVHPQDGPDRSMMAHRTSAFAATGSEALFRRCLGCESPDGVACEPGARAACEWPRALGWPPRSGVRRCRTCPSTSPGTRRWAQQSGRCDGRPRLHRTRIDPRRTKSTSTVRVQLTTRIRSPRSSTRRTQPRPISTRSPAAPAHASQATKPPVVAPPQTSRATSRTKGAEQTALTKTEGWNFLRTR